MITKDVNGDTLPSAFTDRMAEKYLPPGKSPVWEILFCRKDPTDYTCRDVSPLWIQSNPSEQSLGDEFGLSRGGVTEFLFDNAPITRLSVQYTTGTTLTVEPVNHRFTLAIGDWISVSDGTAHRFRRITGVTTANGAITALTVHSALGIVLNATETEIRFAWAIDTPGTDLNNPEQDEWRGIVRVKFGFTDQSERICLFQGDIVGGQYTNDNKAIMACESVTQKLVRFRIEDAVEFDDRGVVSPGAPNPANTGDGYMGEVQYFVNKFPQHIRTAEWIFTFDATVQDEFGNTVGGWDVLEVGIGNALSGNNPPNWDGDNAFLPTGGAGNKRWKIDLAGWLTRAGFTIEIIEGDTAFITGDQFKVWSRASGTLCLVIGADFTTNTILTTGLTAFEPSQIIEEFVDEVVGLSYVNPETGAAGSIFDATYMANFRATTADSRLIRGQFPAGTSAIEIINHALRIVNGWIFPSYDDHLSLIAYEHITDTAASMMNLASDADNPAYPLNVLSIESEEYALEKIRNRIRVQYDLGNDPRTHTGDAIPSQTEFGEAEERFNVEDFSEQPVSIHYAATKTHLGQFVSDYFTRTDERKATVNITATPEALRLEVGDLVTLYSKKISRVETCFVKAIEKNFRTLEVRVTLEEEVT